LELKNPASQFTNNHIMLLDNTPPSAKVKKGDECLKLIKDSMAPSIFHLLGLSFSELDAAIDEKS
jgi:hypothetical protein